jgi:hypothetical protein
VSINHGQAKITAVMLATGGEFDSISARLIVLRLERNRIELGSLAADPHALCSVFFTAFAHE